MTYKELYRESIEKPDSFWGGSRKKSSGTVNGIRSWMIPKNPFTAGSQGAG